MFAPTVWTREVVANAMTLSWLGEGLFRNLRREICAGPEVFVKKKQVRNRKKG